eukprot:4072647-Amphidinium_carterae.1
MEHVDMTQCSKPDQGNTSCTCDHPMCNKRGHDSKFHGLDVLSSPLLDSKCPASNLSCGKRR